MASTSTSTSACTSETVNIPLRRLLSSKRTPSLFSTNTTTPSLPDYASQITTLPSYASSINTITTAASLLPTTLTPFVPTSALQIQSQGKQCISFPLPTKELEIPIFSTETGRPVYLSVRHKRGSGSCVLVDAEDESRASIARTTYAFGPYRNPVVRIGKEGEGEGGGVGDVEGEVGDQFEMAGKSLLNRTIYFESKKLGRFAWRYAGRKERGVAGKDVHNLLVLEKIVGGGEKGERVRVAQLVRSEGTRTPGTGRSCAGNGGRLEMCLSGNAESGEGEGILVDEVTVVVTCLVMLKKEIDRLRAMQIAVMTSGGGGC